MNGLSLYNSAAEKAGNLKVGEVPWRTQLSFYVNGKAVKVEDAEPHQTLLWFLRERMGLTGTKLGCGEGGCGACTVTVSQFLGEGRCQHRAVNACLAPLCSVDGCHVTTVEGLGNATKPHVVQQRVAEFHGSQCGFCTPGIVMSLYTTLCRTSKPTLADIESSFDGNLCRCTGYRPILDAAKTFVCDKSKCPSSTSAEKNSNPLEEKDVKICSSTLEVVQSIQNEDVQVSVDFPEALKKPVEPLKVSGVKVTWYRPSDLATLLMLKKAEPKAKMVAGNTEVGIETKFKHCDYPTMISTAAVTELHQLHIGKDGVLTIGGAVTLSSLEHFLEAQSMKARYQAMLDMLRWFASAQIRNVAVLAGNIATASPISDMNPVLIALNATLILASAGQAPREVRMKDFFKSYRVVDMQPTEVICAIKVPDAEEFEFVRSFKQARRRDDDISIVNACLRVTLKPNADGWSVKTASCVFGGMAPTTVTASQLEAALTGASWTKETIEKAQDVLAEELSLPETVPGGMAAYRQTLAVSFLYKFFVATSLELSKRTEASGKPPAPAIAAEEASAAKSFLSEDRPVTHGSQAYVVPSGGLHSTAVMGKKDHAPLEEEKRAPVGQPVMHRSALPQCTGEAKYVDDMPKLPGTLHAVLVLSERAHAKILSIDTSAAMAFPKVVQVFTGQDLSEQQNAWGPAYVDEQLFRTEEVTATGQALGIVVAETQEAAEKAARLVKVSYSDLQPIITIEDAIQAKSFKEKVLKIEDGDIEAAFKQSDSIVVEGEVRMGGQEHFYLECNAALAIPGEQDELTVHCSSQTANKTQKFAANVCGIPYSKVVCKIKRMGGGFGGKETRTVIFSTAVSLAAHRLKQPVKMNVDRDVDMWVTGGRHPFLARYRAAAGPDGKLRALDAKLYCNAGYSMDLTEPVMGRALFHSDGCYKIPNVKVEGFMCLTHTTSNTAFRGFGGPQGLMVAEAYMTHLASALKMSPEELRIRNTYAFEGEKTHFGQLMEKCPLQRMWHELYESSDFAKRQAAILEFNRQNRWRKRGIAQLPTKFGISFTATFMNQAGALVHIYLDGTVLLTHGGTEMGQGLHTKICQIVARAFDIPIKDVVFRETGTDTVPNASPTAASASSDIYGMATLNACEQIKTRLQPYVEKFGDFKKAVNAAYMDRCDLSAHGFYATPGISYDWSLPEDDRGKPFNYFTYGAASSEVEIDVLTGDMRILRSDILMDVGNSLNPAIDIGQIEGAFTQGFGWATLEETVWGCSEFPWLKPGVCFTRGPGTYKIPSFNDTPVDMRVTLVKDSANPNAIHSSRAVGEPPFFLGTAAFFAARAAIASAREDAGAAAHDYFAVDLPLTPERIRMACNDPLSSRFSKNSSRPRPSIFV